MGPQVRWEYNTQMTFQIRQNMHMEWGRPNITPNSTLNTVNKKWLPARVLRLEIRWKI